MALHRLFWVCFLCLSSVFCKPLENSRDSGADTDTSLASKSLAHRVLRRFIDINNMADGVKGLDNYLERPYRTARSVADECEKLRLCRLHSSGQRNILASFQLYFVNKENAKLWDHQNHNMADCDRLYGDCYGGGGQQHAAPQNQIEFVNSDDDYY